MVAKIEVLLLTKMCIIRVQPLGFSDTFVKIETVVPGEGAIYDAYL